MEYWIIVNEERVGPLTIEALKEYDIKGDTPIWHAGLDDWTPASEITELAQLFNAIENSEVEDVAEEALTDTTSVSETETVETIIEEEKKPLRPCPPSYLVWAVLVIVLCCAPLGIPAIIYSSQVKTKYNNGDYSGARKASERAALWVILAFVGGLIYQPFGGLLSVLWGSLQSAM